MFLVPAARGAISHRIRLVPHLNSPHSLRFHPIKCDLRAGDPALHIGRLSSYSAPSLAAANDFDLLFKCKVVSRAGLSGAAVSLIVIHVSAL